MSGPSGLVPGKMYRVEGGEGGLIVEGVFVGAKMCQRPCPEGCTSADDCPYPDLLFQVPEQEARVEEGSYTVFRLVE